MEKIDSAAAAGQDTSTSSTEQPRRLGDAPATPWIVLALWLSIHLVIVVYWWFYESPGFLGDLWLLFLCAGNLIGVACWVVAWAILAQEDLILRLAYLLAGLAGIISFGWPMFLRGWWGDLLFAVAPLAVIAWGVAAILLLLRRRGWRIQSEVDRALRRHRRAQPRWQFSVGDMMFATTGIGVFLALLLLGGPPQVGEVVFSVAHIVGASAVLVVSLAARSFWFAILISLVTVAAVMASVMLMIEPESLVRLRDLAMLLLWAGPATLGLLFAAGLTRRAGYRLAPQSLDSLAAVRGGVNTEGFPPASADSR